MCSLAVHAAHVQLTVAQVGSVVHLVDDVAQTAQLVHAFGLDATSAWVDRMAPAVAALTAVAGVAVQGAAEQTAVPVAHQSVCSVELLKTTPVT